MRIFLAVYFVSCLPMFWCSPVAGQPVEFLFEFGGTGAAPGQLDGPVFTALDSTGNVYVTEARNSRVSVFDSDGQIQFSFGSHGENPGQFDWPAGITILSSGDIYVADRNNDRIQVFDSNGSFLSEFGSVGSGDGELDRPYGIASDLAGSIFVAEAINDRVSVFDNAGSFQFAFGSTGNGVGQLDAPVGINVDSLGDIYVADRLNHRIQVFDSGGALLREFGSQGTADGEFDEPFGIDVDEDGLIYVTDTGNSRVQVFDNDGLFIYSFGSLGTGEGMFAVPAGITVNNGRIYVCDYNTDQGSMDNNRVQVFAIASDPVPIGPIGRKFLDGVVAGGQLSNVVESDDVYYEVDPSQTKNPVKQKIDMILLAETTNFSPTIFSFVVEAAMTGGPSGDVIQTIELWNEQTSSWEVFDTRAASISDLSVQVDATGDLTQYVHPLTGEVIAKLKWESPDFSGSTFFWSIDVDQAAWLIQ